MTQRAMRMTSFGVLIGLVVAWQIASLIIRAESVPGEPMVPGWQFLASTTLLNLADYWTGGFGVAGIAQGGARTFAGSFLAIVSNSWDTTLRLLVGLLLGASIGFLSGLAVSWSKWSRRIVALPGQILRTFPLLALLPLFELWFGLTFQGAALFIAYAVAVIVFTGTINAVRNVPDIYIANGRTQGASNLQIYRTIILPAMFPELRSTLLLALGTAWTAVVGAEFLGAQTGLGSIIAFSKIFGYVDRMFLVALFLLGYAAFTYALFDRGSRKLTEWMPTNVAERPALLLVDEPELVGSRIIADRLANEGA